MALKQNDSLSNKNEHKGLKLDAKDIENIKNALAIYDRMNPPGKLHVLDEEDPHTGKPIRYIEYCNIGDHLSYIRKTLVQTRKLKSVNSRGFDDPIRLRVSVPPSLEAWLNKAYPKLLTDPVQTEQFLRAFPAFDLTK